MKKSLIIFSIAITMYSVTANADILIYDSLFGGSGDVQNVLFSDTNKNDVGLLVDGFLNQTLEIVNFTGNENLSTPSSGQARIDAADGSFTSILIKMDDPSLGFNKIQFNINADEDGFVKLTYTDQYNIDWSEIFKLGGNGENWFTAISSNNQIITSVAIDSSDPLTQIDDLKQVRLNPMSTEPIPEPATMLLFGTGIAGLASMARRKRNDLSLKTI